MYIQIMSFSWDPDREAVLEEFISIADDARNELKNIEGLQSICGVRVTDGKLVINATYDTEGSASAALTKIHAILANLTAAPPEFQEGPIIWEL